MGSAKILPHTLSQPAPALRLTLKAALRHVPGTVWILLDSTVAMISVLLTLLVLPDRESFLAAAMEHGFDSRWYLFLFSLVTITLAHILGLHEPQMPRDRLRLAINLLVVAAVAGVILITANSVFYRYSGGQKVILFSTVFTWTGMYLLRLFYWRVTDDYRHRVCLIGDRGFLEEVSGELAQAPASLQIRQVAVAPGDAPSPESENVLPATGSEGIRAWIQQHSFDEIVTQGALPESVMAPALSCLDQGTHVFSYSQFVENHFRKVPVRQLGSAWFLHSSLLGLEPHYRIAKRLLDIGIATAGLILTAPLVALAALAIRLTSRGPVFYSQTRVGLYNQPFRIFKLRTMTVNAERAGAKWAEKSDPRVTAVGRLLRKTRIDELPQFWNILRGDMAFIGPRPERPEFTRDLAQQIPFYEKRHLVKPGLTGWAQINYPYGASVEDALRKLEYDLYYVKHGSLQLDLHILVRTIGAIMKGAR